ncbi:hypothetical protein T05_12527 [Trichinella murrelli]|uniref:Uncharacterized protein n=1 Tax=Trichinella murrelli TaxID=144512 RepID=A0A0V0T2Y6_9BILA|nr:hypothetical protein T05_12527 [Trichinella murrelli]
MFYVHWQWKRAYVRIPLVVDVLIWVSSAAFIITDDDDPSRRLKNYFNITGGGNGRVLVFHCGNSNEQYITANIIML